MHSESHFAPIAALDLDPIKVKLMHEESGEGWSLEYADAVEFEYRRFLYLMKMFPHEQAAPRFDVDIFWHYHILDTMKYAVDCHAVFGYFLHHFPYVGLRGEEDLELHQRVGERMRELYAQTYGERDMLERESGHSVGSGKVAFSMNAGKVAFSMNAGKVAFSMNAGKVAFSMNAGTVASSKNINAVACSIADVALSSPGAAVETAYFGAPASAAPAATFNLVRPTLARAA